MPIAKPAQALPVYMQIAELLARQIKAGYWRASERLPTEAELARSLSVAIGTLRKGLALLEQQGVLERIQGSGTYVRRVEGTQQIYELFRLELTNGPGLPTAQVLDLSSHARPLDVPLMGPDAAAPCWRWRKSGLTPVPALPCARKNWATRCTCFTSSVFKSGLPG